VSVKPLNNADMALTYVAHRIEFVRLG
jgi:hypothetical protein